METASMRDRTPVQAAAMLVSVVFVIVGILGFIPGIATDAPGKFVGDDSDAELLGIFQTSILHNIVHLAFGLVGLALARTVDGARTYLIGGGIVYLALGVLGIVGGADWLPTNTADQWLHFALGAGMITIGFVLGREMRRETATTTTGP
jgi:hypothetical protein